MTKNLLTELGKIFITGKIAVYNETVQNMLMYLKENTDSLPTLIFYPRLRLNKSYTDCHSLRFFTFLVKTTKKTCKKDQSWF